LNSIDAAARGRRTLLLLAVVFLGPMAVAMVLYFTGFQWRPERGTHHGALYQPARPLPETNVAWVGGAPSSGTLRGKWSLVHIGGGECAAGCRQALVVTRQVRRALGRDLDRVQRLYLLRSGVPDTAFLAAEHPGIGIVADSATVAEIARIAADVGEGDVFLADPLGNLVMRYPAGTPMKDIHEDLQRLLKISTIG
jgi:hypothetical protein